MLKLIMAAALGILLAFTIVFTVWIYVTQSLIVIIPLAMLTGYFCPEIIWRLMGEDEEH